MYLCIFADPRFSCSKISLDLDEMLYYSLRYATRCCRKSSLFLVTPNHISEAHNLILDYKNVLTAGWVGGGGAAKQFY